MNVPRLIYSGPPTEAAITKRVGTLAELEHFLAHGWRLTRAKAPETETEPEADRNPVAPEEPPQAPALPSSEAAEGEDAGTDQAAPDADQAAEPTDQHDPAPPEAVADAPRPEDTEPKTASGRKKRS